MIEYWGDFLRGSVVRIPLNSVLATGALAAITAPAVAVVRGGSVLTPSGGVSLFGSAGVYEAVVDTSADAATFTKGDYLLRLSAGTVNGVSVAGYWLAGFSLENRAVAPQSGDAFARIGAAGAGLTALPPVTLAAAQPDYAPAKESTLAGLVATVGTDGVNLTAIPEPAGLATLLGRLTATRAGHLDAIPSLATADQVPDGFTDALFASPGVFSSSALVNVPASGGGPVQLAEDQPYYPPARAGDAMTLEADERAALAAELLDLADGVESGETVRQTLRLLRAVLAGRAVAGDGVVAFRRADGTTVALTVTHDESGNRTSSAVGAL